MRAAWLARAVRCVLLAIRAPAHAVTVARAIMASARWPWGAVRVSSADTMRARLSFLSLSPYCDSPCCRPLQRIHLFYKAGLLVYTLWLSVVFFNLDKS